MINDEALVATIASQLFINYLQHLEEGEAITKSVSTARKIIYETNATELNGIETSKQRSKFETIKNLRLAEQKKEL